MAKLSPRMAEAMRYLGEGKRGPDIAMIMEITPGAVHTLVCRAVKRIGAETAEHAIKLLCERGFFQSKWRAGMTTTAGRRVYPDLAQGGALKLAEGDYGRTVTGEWVARPPGSHMGSLIDHEVTEHEDGTITVSPSILDDSTDKPWHGYLERGVWRTC